MAIEVENGVFNWNSNGDEHLPPTLQSVNLQIRKGAHVAACGQVGSGKSALLACMLGEIPKVEGRVRVEGHTAYVAQTAWIQSGTFQENICFGKHMDEALYEKVLYACDLKKDIALFPFGDATVIGERGINLSGGQKQRVQLARALFQEADVYFLDDPFSAVDAHTGSHLFKVLRKGEIVQAGDHRDLLQTGTEFSTLFEAHTKAIVHMQLNSNKKNGDEHLSNGESHHHEDPKSESGVTWQAPDTHNDSKEDLTVPQQLVKEEERATGSVSFKVYWAYATAVAGGAFIPMYILLQMSIEVLEIGSSYWMAWGNSSSGHVSAKSKNAF